MKNKLLKQSLQKIATELNNKAYLQPEIEDWFLNRNYYKLDKDQVRKIIESEFQEEILYFAMISSELGFKAGVDATLLLMNQAPVFNVIDEDFSLE